MKDLFKNIDQNKDNESNLKQIIGIVKCKYLEDEYLQLLLKLKPNSKNRNISIESLDSNIPGKNDYYSRSLYLEDQVKRLTRTETKITSHKGIKEQLEKNKNDSKAEETFEDIYEVVEKYGTTDPGELNIKLAYMNLRSRFKELTGFVFPESDASFGKDEKEKVDNLEKFNQNYETYYYNNEEFKNKHAKYEELLKANNQEPASKIEFCKTYQENVQQAIDKMRYDIGIIELQQYAPNEDIKNYPNHEEGLKSLENKVTRLKTLAEDWRKPPFPDLLDTYNKNYPNDQYDEARCKELFKTKEVACDFLEAFKYIHQIETEFDIVVNRDQ